MLKIDGSALDGDKPTAVMTCEELAALVLDAERYRKLRYPGASPVCCVNHQVDFPPAHIYGVALDRAVDLMPALDWKG